MPFVSAVSWSLNVVGTVAEKADLRNIREKEGAAKLATSLYLDLPPARTL